MTHNADKADHMSKMQRFQFAEFKALNTMLNGARSSREVVEGLVEAVSLARPRHACMRAGCIALAG